MGTFHHNPPHHHRYHAYPVYHHHHHHAPTTWISVPVNLAPAAAVGRIPRPVFWPVKTDGGTSSADGQKNFRADRCRPRPLDRQTWSSVCQPRPAQCQPRHAHFQARPAQPETDFHASRQTSYHAPLRKYSHEYISTQSMRPPTHEYLF